MKYHLSFSLLLFSFSCLAQTGNPSMLWLSGIQTNGSSINDAGVDILDIAVEPTQGAVYIAANCYYNCSFAPNVVITPGSGGPFLVIAKYNSNGGFEWAKNLRKKGFGTINLCAPTVEGVYLATSFTGPEVDLGDNIVVERNCTGASCREGLLAKISQNGQTLWAKSVTGNSDAIISFDGIESVGNGKIMASALYHADSLSFGPGIQYPNVSPNSFFTVIVDAATGNTQSVQFPDKESDNCWTYTMTFNDNGQGMIIGVYYGLLKFSNNLSLFTTAQLGNYFIAGINASGEVQWLRTISGDSPFLLFGTDVDNEGNVYLALDAEPGEIILDGSSILTINTTYASVVLKLNASEFSIPLFIPYESPDIPVMDVKVDYEGTVYTAGYISEALQFDSVLQWPDGCVDGFITATNSDGSPKWARTFGGPGCEAVNNYYSSCIELDQAGNLHAVGQYGSDFNEDGFSLPGVGGFLTKFATNTLSASEPAQNALQIIPNPNSGNFSILMEHAPIPSARLSIQDMQGREVYKTEIKERQTQVLPCLSVGAYIVTIQNGARFDRQKLIVQR